MVFQRFSAIFEFKAVFDGEQSKLFTWKESTVADQVLFTPGEMVKVVSGPFATFTGSIRKVNQSRQMLLVIVQMQKDNPLVIAGTGGVPIELKFQEVVKVTS